MKVWVHWSRSGARILGFACLLGGAVLGGGASLIVTTDAGASGATLYASPSGSAGPCTIGDPCTLTDALASASSGDTVELAAGTYTGTFSLPSITLEPEPGLGAPVTLSGGGAVGTSVVTVSSGTTATVNGLTITDGGGAWGGAVYDTGSLTLENDTVSNSTATGGTGGHHYGGGIYDDGTLNVHASTISGNVATGDAGGGIFIDIGGSANVTYSTLSGNSAYAGGGIYNYEGHLSLFGSTLANNSASATAAELEMATSGPQTTLSSDIFGTSSGAPASGECGGLNPSDSSTWPISDGYNFSDDGSCELSGSQSANNTVIDDYLGSLGSYGGPTETVPLLPSSTATTTPDPALGVDVTASCTGTDQRGVARTSPCDSGAFELTQTSLTLAPSTAGPIVGQSVTFTTTVSPVPDGGTATVYVNSVPATCDDGTVAQAVNTTTGQATCRVTFNGEAGQPVAVTNSFSGDLNFAGVGPGTTEDLITPQSPPAPTLTAISPNSGPAGGGTTVTLGGTYLASARVFFGAALAIVLSDDATQVVVTAPPGTGTVDVTVQTPTGGSNAEPYTYIAPPHGYWLVGSDGGIFSFGSAQFYGSMGGIPLQRPVVGIVPTSNRGGYWLDASDGGVFSFGDTQFYGSIPGLGLHPAGSGLPNSLNAPIVGMVPSHDQGGYFMVASDGGVFAFGDAHFAGSCPGIGGCSGAAVAVMPDASGSGYWLVTATGSVYTFGDAPYMGAPGDSGSPVTSAVATPDGHGYWILDANGEVFAYGDATLLGNAPTGGLDPDNAIFATSDGGGYWVANATGAVFTFGDAPNDGGMSGTHLNGSIIAASGS